MTRAAGQSTCRASHAHLQRIDVARARRTTAPCSASSARHGCGSRAWSWTMPQLAAIIQHPSVELFAVDDGDGREVGMLELDFREPRECELAFVGLVPELSGQGHGRWLLAEAVRRAWRDGVNRVHVHTCSLDHPAALSAYRRAGFTPVQARDRALSRPAPARHPADATARLRCRCWARSPERRAGRRAGRRSAPASPRVTTVKTALDQRLDRRDDQRAETTSGSRLPEEQLDDSCPAPH